MKNKSDRELVDFLSEVDSVTIETLIQMMDTKWQVDVDNIKSDFQSTGVPDPSTSKRAELAEKLVYILRYFGSHSISYSVRMIFSDEPGVHYSEICRDVSKNLNKQLKKHIDIPRVASVSDYEHNICEIMLKIQFEGKTEEEIAEMLKDSGLDRDAIKQTAKELAKFAGVGTGLLALVKILGKKTVTEIISKIIVMIVAKKLGEEAAKKLAARILAKLAQKTIAKIISGVGWVLLIWDAVDLLSPATRITIPSVCLIAAVRTARRLEKKTELMKEAP